MSSRLYTPSGAAKRLASLGVKVSPARVRQLDDELDPITIDDGGPGQRAYREDALAAFVQRRKAGAR